MAVPLSNKLWVISIIIILQVICLNNICVHAQLDLDKLDLNNQLTDELKTSNFSVDNFKELFRNKCIEVSGEESGTAAYTEIEAGLAVFAECLTTFVNVTTLQQEIEDASPRGELDEVFHKYCNKRTNALDCFEVFNSKLSPCLDKEEQESQDVIKRIIKSLLNFVCHKDGDQIALFIAEKGPECFEAEKDNIQQCINNTLSPYFNTVDIRDNNVKSIPKLVVGEKQCDDIKTLETCIVKHLGDCSEITPANLVESMFNFIRNETICRTYQGGSASKQSAENSSSGMTLQIFNIMNYILLFFLIKITLR